MVELGEMLLTFCTVALGVVFFLPGYLRHSGPEGEQRQLGYERQQHHMDRQTHTHRGMTHLLGGICK